jgi:hypothetical protein
MRDTTTLQNHARVHAVRAIVLGLIRFAAMVMVVVGLVMVFNRVLYGMFGVSDLSASIMVFRDIGETHGMYLGLPLVAFGVVLGVMSRRLSHWVVRVPEIGCAGCGYETVGDDGQCSECGYR